MKRLPQKNRDTQSSVINVSQSVPDIPQKTPQTLKKKRVKKVKKDPKLTRINSDFKEKTSKLKSDIKGLRYPAEYLDFIDWMSLPPVMREPRTHKEFAKQIRVGEDTLTSWKKRAGFWDDVVDQRKDWARDQSGDLLLGLKRNAVKYGKGTDVKVWLQYTGEFTEKADINFGVSPELQKIVEKIDQFLP